MGLGRGSSHRRAINAPSYSSPPPPLTFPRVVIANHPYGHPTNNTAATRYNNSIMARPIHAAAVVPPRFEPVEKGLVSGTPGQ